ASRGRPVVDRHRGGRAAFAPTGGAGIAIGWTAAVPGDRKLIEPLVQDGGELIQLLLAMACGDGYPQARLAFGDDRMRNPLHVKAALLAVMREPERRPIVAADHREDCGRAV